MLKHNYVNVIEWKSNITILILYGKGDALRAVSNKYTKLFLKK